MYPPMMPMENWSETTRKISGAARMVLRLSPTTMATIAAITSMVKMGR